MQRKALKQLNKVTQWTNEKVFSSERTQFSEDFAEFETEIEPYRQGIERLHATSVPFFEQLTKVKPSADPHRPSGSKDKMHTTEALGLVMIDYGNDVGGDYGDGLVKYGRARCKLAIMQDEFSERLNDGYIQATEAALSAVNEYKLYRKKMDSRRLTLDSALSRAKTSKKENPSLEQEVEIAQLRLDETEEETKLRMIAIKEQEAAQFASLADLVDAELEYFTKCKEILEDLRVDFPSAYSGNSGQRSQTQTRARAKSNASARSAGRAAGAYSGSPDSDDEEAGSRSNSKAGNRSRSDSAASAGSKPKGRGIMSSIGSIGSFGVKTASSAASKAKSKSFRKKEGEALLSEDEPQERDNHFTSPSRPTSSRTRSHSVMSSVTSLGVDTTPRRRAITSPSSPVGEFVKVLYDFEGLEGDELPLRAGQIVQVKQEISDDWAIGECEGMSGLFPRAYTEEYIPSPSTVIPATRRALPPIRRASAVPSTHSMTTDDDTDGESLHDNDDSTGLAAAAQPTPVTANRSRASSIKKSAPPPPPPSRRVQSSNALGTRSPPPPTRSRSSTITRANSSLADTSYHQVQSPFDHSDDDSHQCEVCGCGDFTQNVFKSKGTCSTCFHQH